MTKCPNCGTMNEAGSRFCFQCGQTLSADGQADEGQRTQPVNPPSFPRSPQFPGQTGPVSGYPPVMPPPPPASIGMPPGTSYPQANPYPQGESPPQGGYAQPGAPPQGGFPQPGYPQGGYPPGTQPGYMMPPEPPRRRRWLWITLGIILGCILLCVAFAAWGFTAGEDTVERLGTQLSEFSTEEANP